MKKLYRGPYIDAFCQVWFLKLCTIALQSIKLELPPFLAHLTQRVIWGIAITCRPSVVRRLSSVVRPLTFHIGGNSNLIDCNAIAQNKKGGNSNLIDCNAITQNKKGGNSNLIDCNAIVHNLKKGVNSNLIDCNHCNLLNWGYLPFSFSWLHCNLLNWSYLSFIFCKIALQSIKLELPLFLFMYCWFIFIVLYNQQKLPMHFNIWTVEISVAFKITK
jgi:hypothetical protein